MWRSILSVVAGYLVFAVSAVALFALSGHEPHAQASLAFLLGSTIYGVFFALVAGYVAATLAPQRPLLHAIIVAAIIAVAAGVSLATRPEEDQGWHQLATLLLMAPAAWVGGWWCSSGR